VAETSSPRSSTIIVKVVSKRGSSNDVGSARRIDLGGMFGHGNAQPEQTHESKIPNDMDMGAAFSSSGEVMLREHMVRPVSSLKVAFGS
jgi:hypothetical protein